MHRDRFPIELRITDAFGNPSVPYSVLIWSSALRNAYLVMDHERSPTLISFPSLFLQSEQNQEKNPDGIRNFPPIINALSNKLITLPPMFPPRSENIA